ncbi:MAG: CoA transferase [Pseudomonadales bacterium]|nr:CoA transferase [Pseudomonadales bacterium]
MTTEAALAGLKVLDLAGTIASGYCGKLFADHGAQVINVEPPDGGFETRREPPFIPGADAPESSALHAYLSTNKASVALDVGTEPEQLSRLARDSAVVLDGGRFDCAAFAAVAPEVVVSTITWFGRHGPYAEFKGNGAVCWSLGGMVRNVGPEQGPPWVPTGCGAEIVGGLAAYIGTLGQVIARVMGNALGPVRLDTSIHESNLCFTEVGGVGGYRSGRRGKRLGVNRFAPTYPLGVYACADGWLGVTALTPLQWRNFCSLLAMDQYADEPDYQTAIGRLMDYDTLEPIIRQRVRKRSAAELVTRGQSLRIPLAPVPTMEELFSVDQYVHRGAFTGMSCNGTDFKVPVTPFRLYRTPANVGGEVEGLGESNAEFLR